ncbi:MAG: nuclear transport factor 2 family protein [Ktedonobacterales bacterium]
MSATGTPRARMLLVEDDTDLRLTAEMALVEQGYAVQGAATLVGALALVDQHTFRLVLTDLFATSASNPLQSVEELRDRVHPTPVGVMTSWQITPEAARAHGFAFLLPKPFELEDLFACVSGAQQQRLTRAQERLAAMARRYFDTLAQHDWRAAADLCAAEVEFGALDAVAPARALRGREALAAHTREILRQLPDVRFDEVLVYAAPRGVATRYAASWSGTDGTERRQSGTVVFTFNKGFISQIRVRVNVERLRALIRSRPLKLL